MEASEEILLNSLENCGVPIPVGVFSVGNLTPDTLFCICSHALRLIDGHHSPSSFPVSLPDDSMPDRIKIFTDLADAFNNLGFKPALSFHKFLYSSKEDLYKLIKFLVGKLSEPSGAQVTDLGDGDNIRCVVKEKPSDEGDSFRNEEIVNGLKDIRLKNQALQSPSQNDAAEPNSLLGNVEIRVEESNGTVKDPNSSGCDRGPSEGVESSIKNAFKDYDGSQNQEQVDEKLMKANYPELQHLDEELQSLKAAVEMSFDGQHSLEFYVEELNGKVEAKRQKLKELESEWDAIEQPLQEKKRNLEQLMFSCRAVPSEELKRTKEIELETEFLLAQIKIREEELSKLSSDIEKQPKLGSRRSYIERINEITKNSRKQDDDIQHILKDTRELQLESNTIQERLNRTYAIVNETIFREAKKDHIARQAYRLVSKIHERFEQVAENILAADRNRRDAAALDAKLAIINARSFNLAELQANLDAIRKENELLEQQL